MESEALFDLSIAVLNQFSLKECECSRLLDWSLYFDLDDLEEFIEKWVEAHKTS